MKFYVYLHREQKEYGPYEPEDIIEQLYEGTVAWTDAIRPEAEAEWAAMGDVFNIEELEQA